MNTKRIILATLAIWLFVSAWTMLTCGWLFNWVYSIPPVIWKTPQQMMGMGNTALSLLTMLIGALVFVLVFSILYKGIPGNGIKKGMHYGFLVWLIGPMAGIVGMPFYMTIANTVVIYWILNFLVSHIIMGALVGLIYRPKK